MQSALDSAGGVDDVEALAVGAQRHGMVALDPAGEPVFDALLWNDTRSPPTPGLGAAARCAVVGRAHRLVAGRILHRHETGLAGREHPELAARVEQVMLPHDYLTWRLRGGGDATTDRGDASGTGYFSPTGSEYLPTSSRTSWAVRCAYRGSLVRPGRPVKRAGCCSARVPGTTWRLRWASGRVPGDVVVSIGTSGTVFASGEVATADPRGSSPGSPTRGGYLPLVCAP